jgi:hypothetical protein
MSEVYRPVGDGATHREEGEKLLQQVLRSIGYVATLGSTLVWKSSMVFISLGFGMKPL